MTGEGFDRTGDVGLVDTNPMRLVRAERYRMKAPRTLATTVIPRSFGPSQHIQLSFRNPYSHPPKRTLLNWADK
jgi:hypothetical protein